jgi:hypothetical protein
MSILNWASLKVIQKGIQTHEFQIWHQSLHDNERSTADSLCGEFAAKNLFEDGTCDDPVAIFSWR